MDCRGLEVVILFQAVNADEEQNPERSFDINLYKAELQLQNIQPF